jgi:type I restriction-modification system DNA methylase subunit
MIWIAPSEKDADNASLEKRPWDSADQFRANSGLKAQTKRRVAKCEFRSAASSTVGIRHPTLASLSIHGVEKTDETGRLCRLNLAVHGLEGDIRHGAEYFK